MDTTNQCSLAGYSNNKDKVVFDDGKVFHRKVDCSSPYLCLFWYTFYVYTATDDIKCNKVKINKGDVVLSTGDLSISDDKEVVLWWKYNIKKKKVKDVKGCLKHSGTQVCELIAEHKGVFTKEKKGKTFTAYGCCLVNKGKDHEQKRSDIVWFSEESVNRKVSQFICQASAIPVQPLEYQQYASIWLPVSIFSTPMPSETLK